MKFSNVFVLSTGRCGSTTFTKACSHISNYSSGHETKIHSLHPERLNYPANHIEADNRLSWCLGLLDEKFGNNALYVHLIREKESCVESFAKRVDYGILKAYSEGILLRTDSDPTKFASDYYDTVNANIRQFLRHKPFKLTMHLEKMNSGRQFQDFWKIIDADGDLNAAMIEWKRRHNSSK